MKRGFFRAALFGCLLMLTALITQAQNQTAPAKISENEKKEVIELIGKRLIAMYVLPDVGKQMAAALTKNYDDGAYKAIEDPRDFAFSLTRDLRGVSRDGHLDVFFNPQGVLEIKSAEGKQNKPSAEVLQREIKRARQNNFGFREVRILEGNIGYLNLTGFTDLKLGTETAMTAAMNFLSNTDAIIIDLRNNGGGYAEAVTLLVSYFFDEKPVLLSDFYTRNGTEEKREQEWTLKKVNGKKRPGTDVYLLTANRTFSAAESFAYSLQNYKKAITVGEKTGGGAHIVDHQIINDNFVLKVPNGRPIDPITKTNWEQTGIKPDIETAPQSALLTAHIKALEKRAATAEANAKFSYEWLLTEMRAKLNPPRIDEAALRSYAGNYKGELGQRTITFENGRLFTQRVNGPKVALIALATNVFTPEGRSDIRVKLNVENNRVVGLTSTSIDGSVFQEIRDKDGQ